MAVVYRASATARGSASAATITIPAAVLVGDVMYIGVCYKLTGTGAINTPSGWTVVPNCQVSGPTVGFQTAAFRKTAVSGDTGGAATVSITCNSGSQQIECEFVAYGNCEDAPRASQLTANSTTASTSVTCTTVASQTGDVVLLFAGWRGSNTSGPSGSPNLTAAPAGFTLRQQSTNLSSSANVGGVFADNLGSGTTGTVSFTSDASAYSVGGQIILVPTMTAPTFVAEGESADWGNSNTGVAKTSSVSVTNGQQLVVVGMTEDQVATLGTPSGGGLTFTPKQSVVVSTYATAYVWTAPVTSTQTFTLSITMTVSGGGSRWWGFSWATFSGSDGIGASNKTNVSSGAPSLSLTTLFSNSAVLSASSDWNAADGSSRTWRTVNSITPTSGNSLERVYFRDASHYAAYAAYWSNAGAYGAKTLGLSAPSGQKYAIVAVEVLGTQYVPVTVADTPSGMRAGGTPTTVSVGAGGSDTTIAAAPSSGTRAGSSPATVTTTVVITDRSAGARAGSSPTTVAAGVTSTDRSTGARAGGSAATVTNGTTVTDRPAAVRAAGGATAITTTVVLTDRAVAARAVGSPAVAAAGTTVADTPRGSRGGGSPATVTTGVAVADTSRGSRAGGTPTATTLTVVITDHPTPIRAGGTPATQTVGVTVNTGSVGARAGGSAAPAAVAVTTTDRSQGARAAGSATTTTVGVGTTDTSRGAQASGSTSGVTYITTLADTSRGARAGGGTQQVTVGSGDDLVITDRSTSVRGGGAPAGVTYTTTLPGTSTGVRAGASPATVATDVVVTDRPQGLRVAAGATDTTTGVVVTDTAGAARTGRTPAAAVITVVTVDTPSGARAATSVAATTYATLAADRASATRAGGSDAAVTTGGPAAVAIVDRSTGARAGQVTETRTVVPGRITADVGGPRHLTDVGRTRYRTSSR